METPVTRGRHRSRCSDRKKKSREIAQAELFTSTPSTSSRAVDDSDSDSDMLFPCTQAPIKPGDVFWNYEASPSTKEALRRKLNETDSPGTADKPLPEPEPLTPSIKLRTRIPEGPKLDQDDIDLLNSIANSYKRNLDGDDSGSDKDDSKTVVKETNNTFSSDDDSFLVQCTQTVEAAEKAKKNNSFKFRQPATVVIASSKSISCFDDDDGGEMDAIMSQIDMPAVVEKIAPSTTTKRTPFKRFKSDDDVRKPAGKSSAVMMGWRRNNSSPDTPTGPPLPGGRNTAASKVRPKCTQAEIELKRQQAIQRRKNKLQR